MTSAGDGGTCPLPSVGGPGVRAQGARSAPQDDLPTTVIGRVPDREIAEPVTTAARAVGRGLRSIELISGLLGGGVLLAGLVLLVLQFVAPAVVTAGTGPGWSAVAVHLGVGIVAEVLRAVRGRLRTPVRWTVAALVIAAAAAVLLLIWW